MSTPGLVKSDHATGHAREETLATNVHVSRGTATGIGYRNRTGYKQEECQTSIAVVVENEEFMVMKVAGKPNEKFSFEKRWAPSLKADGFVPISTFFLENYHRLRPFDLTYGEAMFVIHLMQHKWTEHAPYPAYKTISQRMHVSAKSARRWAASLEKKGYLRREKQIGATNRFHLNGLMDALVSLKATRTKEEERA